MNKYCLVTRNNDNGSLSTILIKDSWYLSDGTGNCSKFNSLAAIDLVTTRFNSYDQMIKQMYNNHYIDSLNSDVFIATRVKKNNKYYINTYEVLYNNNSLVNDLRNCSKNNLNKKTLTGNSIIDRMISFYRSDFLYRNMVNRGEFNLPKKLIDSMSSLTYSSKYSDSSWINSSYNTIRNIVESFERFDSKKKVGKRDYSKLDELLDTNNCSGQLNMFDMDCFKEEKIISKDDKKKYIYKTLSHLPMDVFSTDLDNNYILNDSFGKRLNKNIYLYALHCNYARENYNMGLSTYEFDREIVMDEEKLERGFNNSKTLDKTYEWTLEYKKSIKEKSLGKRKV